MSRTTARTSRPPPASTTWGRGSTTSPTSRRTTTTPSTVRRYLSTRPDLAIAGALVALSLAVHGIAGWYIYHLGYWHGADGGVYLSNIEELGWPWGRIAGDFLRLPLGPGYVLWPMVELFGQRPGLAMYSVLAAVTLPIAAYILARQFMGRGPSVLASIYWMFDPWMSAYFFDGVAFMYGYCILVLACAGLVRTSRRQRYGLPLLLGSLALLPWVHHTATAIAPVVLGLLWLGLPDRRRTALALAGAAFLALPALPWYLEVLPFGSNISQGDGRLVEFIDIRIYTHPWGGVLGAVVACLIAARSDCRPSIRVLVPLAVAGGLIGILGSQNHVLQNFFFRFPALSSMIAGIMAAPYLWRGYTRIAESPAGRRRAAGAVVAGAAAVMIGMFVWHLALKVAPNNHLYPADRHFTALVEEIEELRGRGYDPDGYIVADDPNTAWYLEAVTGLEASWVNTGGAPESFRARLELAECALYATSCGARARGDGVDWIVLNDDHPIRVYENGLGGRIVNKQLEGWPAESAPETFELAYTSGPLTLYIRSR